ncbi:hypothetical protein V1508DRAFT_426256 [Lipomyces doorenjongii]|uniref:uncharacterized protein n=1 Tax=Lipomyces doorenjongii TaxID=383834 RepID=UPI0034CD1936
MGRLWGGRRKQIYPRPRLTSCVWPSKPWLYCYEFESNFLSSPSYQVTGSRGSPFQRPGHIHKYPCALRSSFRLEYSLIDLTNSSKNMATLNAYQRRMSAGSSNGGSVGMLANGTSKTGSSSSPTMYSASLPAFGSVYIRVVDDSVGSFQYMIPIAEVITYPLLFGMVRKLNTNKRIFEGDHAFTVHVDEDGHPGAIILERFWDKVVRDGLRVIITYKSGTAPQQELPIDKALSSGLGSHKDQDDVFFPHYT